MKIPEKKGVDVWRGRVWTRAKFGNGFVEEGKLFAVAERRADKVNLACF